MMLRTLRNGLLRYARNDGKHTSDSKYLSLRATKSRSNPLLILITLLILCFSPCQAAVEFDGNLDYIEVTNNPSLIFGSSNFSLTAWFKAPPSAKQDFRTIISKNWSPCGFWIQTDSLGRVIGGLCGAINVTSTADNFDNTWHHVALVREGIGANQLKLYIDGVLDTQGTDSNIDIATNAIRIGSFTTIGSRDWIGQLDDVRIYSRDLSSSEVEILYKSKSKRTGSQLTNGLLAHYEMDDDAIGEVVAQAKDSSGNLNHGQFIGFDNLVSNGFSSDVPVQIGTGYSLEFDGVNDLVDTIDDGASNGIGPFHFDDTQDWTVMIWYKGSDNETNSEWGKTLMGRDNNDIWANLVLRNGRVEYIHYNGFWQHNIISNSIISDNQWHFITYVNHSNATGDLYIDSSPNLVGASSTFDDPSRRFVISSLMRAYSNKFTHGLIDDARIYNRALTASEISFLYNGSGLDPGTSNLQALWTFDGDSALKDSSGNNNHGVGVGGNSLKYTEGVLKR